MGSKDLAPIGVVRSDVTTYISSKAGYSLGDIPLASNIFGHSSHNDIEKSFKEALLGETNHLGDGSYVLVFWKKPDINITKINTDGSVALNSFGGGGLLRDYNGDVIIAFAIPLKKCSVEIAEILALNYALNLCISLDIHKIWIEMDALLLVDAIIGSKTITRYISDVVRNTKKILSSFDYSITHIYREGNYCADWLAKYGAHLDYGVDLTNQQIPNKIKSLIDEDKMGLPHVRK